MNITKTLDAKGLACPMPIVRARKAIDEIGSGEVLQIHTTDRGTVSDMAAWSKSGGHDLLEQKEEDGVFTFWIKKG